MDQEEKILCAEVQEAEDPPTQDGPEEEDPSPTPTQGDAPGKGSEPGDCKDLIQQLQALIQGAAQPRKKARSGPAKDEEGDATMNLPPGWENDP